MTTSTDKILLVIAGPTATGKTETAIRVASHLGTEIISADSRQFYREMTIGTAKPTPLQLAQVPHHFIGHISIHEEFNVSKFEKEALALLDKLFAKYRTVVMTGGSGMYIDAVCLGMDDMPQADPAIRQQLKSGFERYGIQYLRNRLLDLDPDYYQEVDISNPQRLIRALEVCMTTGIPYTALRLKNSHARPFRSVSAGLMPARDVLYNRINARVESMIGMGLEEEARGLYPYRHLNALQTVGYSEFFRYFEGKSTFSETVEKIKTNTRRYAKRQITWFRRDQEMTWFDPGETGAAEAIIAHHASIITPN
jgi:tRNA dimethylallyltransferase